MAQQCRIVEMDLVCREGESAWVQAKNDPIIGAVFSRQLEIRPVGANAANARAEHNAARVAVFLLIAFFAWAAYLASDRSSSIPGAAAESDRIEQEHAAAAEAEAKRCASELKCLGEKFDVESTVACRRLVERLAKNDFQWTDGWLEPKFSHYRWGDKARGVVTYIGDKIKFQNGFGAWTFYTYECDFDTRNKKVTDVRAQPGRI
jgi:hypothetical protein